MSNNASKSGFIEVCSLNLFFFFWGGMLVAHVSGDGGGKAGGKGVARRQRDSQTKT